MARASRSTWPAGSTYEAYGYPAAAPFNGQTIKSCAGTAQNDIYGGTQSQRIPCDMTGGSSGGPWFTGGLQNSLNSFGYNGIKNQMFGPYFGVRHPDRLQQRSDRLARAGHDLSSCGDGFWAGGAGQVIAAGATSDPVEHDVPQTHEEVEHYWTDERMRAARAREQRLPLPDDDD